MRTIYFNSSVAERCGKNGIIKAVLLNYVYNYHKRNIRKGAGTPACIQLSEFVYQYKVDEKGLWERSFIHRNLKKLTDERFLIKTTEDKVPTYSVSSEIVQLLTDKTCKIVSFDLEMAYVSGIHVAIMHRFLLHAIDQSPHSTLYNLQIDKVAEVNRLSKSQIYRAISFLEDTKVISRCKTRVKFHGRTLGMTRYKPEFDKSLQTPVKRCQNDLEFSIVDGPIVI